MFITFEGPEGCGKSTHSKRVKNYLESKNHEVVLTHEPGGTQLGKHIRELLLDPESVLSENTEVYLFAADRCEHVNKIILPGLKQGKIVISDRFTDSTLAYQIGGRGLPEDLVRYINRISSGGLIPDLTVLLDVSPETGIKRATELGSLDRFEREKIGFHKKVREKYLEIAKGDAERIKLINTDDKEIDEVQEKIRKMVEKVLNEKR